MEKMTTKDKFKQFFKKTQFDPLLLSLFILYGFISSLHFGFFFYDLDKLITNLAITFIGILLSHVYILKKDVSAIDKIVTKLDNKENN